MTTKTFRRAAFVAALLPLALALVACGKKDGDSAAPTSAGPIAKIVPPAGKAWTDVVTVTPEGGYLMGNPAAPIKLVEYGSLTCPHCAKLSQESFVPLTSKYVASGRVSYEFRSFAIHPQDVPLTMLTRCAPTEVFFPLVEQIYTNFDAMNAPYNDKPTIDRAQAAMQLPPTQRWAAFSEIVGYTQFFAQRGIPADKAKSCLADMTLAKQVADQSAKYGEAGIDSTPTVLINDAKIDVKDSWASLEPALQNAGAR